MKILIVSTYFPPQNSIASLRPYSWAKYWSRAGHDVTVLTTKKFDHPTDSVYPYTGFTVYEVEIPFHRMLRRAFGEKTIEKHIETKQTCKSKIVSFGMRSFRRVFHWLQNRYGIFNACRLPDLADFWVHPAVQTVSGERWDLVVSTAWPYLVHHVAYKLREKGIAERWIADWRDLWTENPIFPGMWPFTFLEKNYERRWLEKADIVTTVSEPLSEILKLKCGDKVSVIYNGFDPEDYENLPIKKAYPQDNIFRIVYTGSIYVGRRDPSPLFRAVSQLHNLGRITPQQLRMIFYGNNSDMSSLAERFNILEYVEYGGFLPRQNVLHFQRDADALLFLELEADNARGILTGKLFEYLFAGPPILAVGIDAEASAASVMKEIGRGEVFGNQAELIAQKIVELMEAKKKGTLSRLSLSALQGDEKIFLYSRKRQAEKMLGLAFE